LMQAFSLLLQLPHPTKFGTTIAANKTPPLNLTARQPQKRLPNLALFLSPFISIMNFPPLRKTYLHPLFKHRCLGSVAFNAFSITPPLHCC
jgi:hypothetical protein